MNGITKDRLLVPVIMLLLCGILIKWIKPRREELKAAFFTSLIIAAGDYILEIAAGKLNLWHYHGEFMFLGLPPDMFADFVFLVLFLCLGWIYFKRKGARQAALYKLVLFFVLGTYALLHNKRALDLGFITFSEKITYGTIWYTIGCYVLLGFLLAGALFLYEIILSRISRKHTTGGEA